MFNLQLVFVNKYLKQKSVEENSEKNLSVVSPECETCAPCCDTANALVEYGGTKD